MTSRERIRTIIGGGESDRCGFWLGNPHPDAWLELHRHFGTTTEEELRRTLNDDFRWIQAGTYKHPEGRPAFDMQRKGPELSAEGVFADCESVEEVDAFTWPDPSYLDFTETLAALQNAGDVYRAGGFWSPFFHEVCDFFGMEKYFTRLYTHPDVVHSVTGRIVDFYLEANRRLFEAAGDLLDGFFFGNDFGTQRDLMMSPDLFADFVAPYLKRLVDLGKSFGKQVILHSCGSIRRVIPLLIDFGVDALHPLQANASGMDASTLAEDFKGNIAFIGGIDTQDLLVNASPDQVKAEVRRIVDLLGPNLVVSPSHEALLPNVPPQNVAAMAAAATE